MAQTTLRPRKMGDEFDAQNRLSMSSLIIRPTFWEVLLGLIMRGDCIRNFCVINDGFFFPSFLAGCRALSSFILGEMKFGKTGAFVATPNENSCQNVIKNSKKRKQPEITDFFAKKQINKKWFDALRPSYNEQPHYKPQDSL